MAQREGKYVQIEAQAFKFKDRSFFPRGGGRLSTKLNGRISAVGVYLVIFYERLYIASVFIVYTPANVSSSPFILQCNLPITTIYPP